MLQVLFVLVAGRRFRTRALPARRRHICGHAGGAGGRPGGVRRQQAAAGGSSGVQRRRQWQREQRHEELQGKHGPQAAAPSWEVTSAAPY